MTPPASPGFFRRLACLFYESVLLVAVLMFAALVFLLLFGDATEAPKRYFLQGYLWLVSGAYFVRHWTRSGQTLAMKTWRVRLVDADGALSSPRTAIKRFVLATLFFGVGFVWALFDRNGLYLHDRLSGTRLSLDNRPVAKG